MPPACRDCIAFQDDGTATGECRRHPPVTLMENRAPGEARSWWPSVRPDDWCGDFVPRAERGEISDAR